MKILTFDQVLKNYPSEREYDIANEIEKRLREKYSAKRGDIIALKKLTCILAVTNGDWINKKFLDLGCGAYGVYDDNGGRDFEPWVCRGLVELGINPMGIDIFDNSKEKFESYNKNLAIPNALNFIPDNSIDVAYSCGLFSSPFLNISIRKGKVKGNLREILLPQLERIVKPDGFFIYTN